MLHGWGTNARVFAELAGELASYCDVMTPDLPGYGGVPDCEPHTLENLAARVASDAPQRCAVVGWSLGAQVALTWARERPQQVGALVLIGATPCFVRRSAWDCAMDAATFDRFDVSVRANAASALDRFVSLQAQGDDDERRVIRRLRAAISGVDAPRAEVLANGLNILRTTDLRPCLHDITQPVLVVQGALDRLVPAAAGEYLARTLGAAALATISGAAHAPFISQPRSVSRTIFEFLDAH
jgi:pimeloyl-[acyl-carrier protein] methyl ester esterase